MGTPHPGLPGDGEGWPGRSCGHGVRCCMGGGGTGTPWVPPDRVWGCRPPPGWRGAVPHAPAALPCVLGSVCGGVSVHPVPSPGWTQGRWHPWEGDPWEAAGWTHGHGHSRGDPPPTPTPQPLGPITCTQATLGGGGLWVLPAPWGHPAGGCHRGAVVAVVGHGEYLGCRGGPKCVLSGDGTHLHPPGLASTPAQCQLGGGEGGHSPPHPPQYPPPGKHSRGVGAPLGLWGGGAVPTEPTLCWQRVPFRCHPCPALG